MSSAEPGSADLEGRVVVVTGAARGQGRAIAERILSVGGFVIAGDVLDDVGALATSDPSGRWRDDAVVAGHLDVTDAGSWDALLARGIERFGRIDGLVNNAGVLRRASLDEETPAQFTALWEVNCLGPFLGIQAVAPHLRAAGGGAIVNTISTAAITAWTGHGAYASSKWALRGLTKVAALELAADRIRVNAILPGPVQTPMVVPDDDPAAAARMPRTPIGRVGLPTDIAELVVFLLSDRSTFLVGAEVVIDGGQTAGTVLREPPPAADEASRHR